MKLSAKLLTQKNIEHEKNHDISICPDADHTADIKEAYEVQPGA